MRFRRDHRFTAEHASDYLDGDLHDAGRECVEQHARFCPKCHELLASLRRTVDALGALGRAERHGAGADVAPMVIDRLRALR